MQSVSFLFGVTTPTSSVHSFYCFILRQQEIENQKGGHYGRATQCTTLPPIATVNKEANGGMRSDFILRLRKRKRPFCCVRATTTSSKRVFKSLEKEAWRRKEERHRPFVRSFLRSRSLTATENPPFLLLLPCCFAITTAQQQHSLFPEKRSDCLGSCS